MNRKFVSLLVFLVATSAISCARVEPGYVGVKTTVNGIESEPLDPRRYALAPGEKIYEFPTFLQNETFGETAEEAPITFASGEGSQFSAVVTVSYQFDPQKAVETFEELRQPPDVIAESYIRRQLADIMNRVSSNYTAVQLYGTGKSQFIDEVQSRMQEEFNGSGVIIDSVSLQSLQTSPEVQASIERVIKASQDAEAAKKEGEATIARAQAQAEANRILSESISQEVIQYEMIERWTGEQPISIGNGSLVTVPLQ